MKRWKQASIALAMVACGAAQKPIAQRTKPSASSASIAPSASSSVAPLATIDPHFREHEPELGPPANFVMPDVKVTKLASGLRILSANVGGGMFAMRVSFAGFAAFPTERAAVARLMVKSMFGGTPTEDAHALRRVLEKRFATWSTYTEPDVVAVEMWMPADDMNACIDTIADVVMHPEFDQLTLGFELLQLVEQGQTARESPDTLAARAFVRAIYGDTHPYARSTVVLDGSATVAHAEVQRIWEELADPATTTVSLAGAIDAATLNHVQRAFASFRARNHPHAAPLAAVNWLGGARVVVVDRPGSVRSEIRFGGLAPSRASSDWYAMQLIDEILGAHRSSRITRDIVEKNAWSLGGATHHEMRRGESTFYWSSGVPAEHTADALAAIDKAFEALGQTAPSAEELDEKKALYLRQIPRLTETAIEGAELVATIAEYGLPEDALAGLAARVQAVTPDEIRALAHARLASDRTRAIVVGDWSKLKPSLKALGWGPIEIRDTTGKLVATEK